MTQSDANDPAADPRRSTGFWLFASFAALAVLAAAIPLVRSGVLAVLTFPLRLIGWALPGGDVYDDAVWAARILGWIGWIAIAFLWSPLLVIVVGVALKALPALHRRGAVWSETVRGERGLAAATVAWALGFLPLVAAAAGVGFGLLLAWALGFGALVSAALLAPGLMRRSEEHPVVALVRWGAGVVDWFCRLVGDSARWAALALVLVVATAVTQRYVFGITFTKLDELVVYLHAALFMLVAAATLKADGHVRVDVFYGGASPWRRSLINFIGVYALLAPMCLVILMNSARFVDLAWRVSEGSTESDGLPLVYLLKTVIPTFAVLLLAQGAALAARDALVLVGVDAPEPEAEHPPHDMV